MNEGNIDRSGPESGPYSGLYWGGMALTAGFLFCLLPFLVPLRTQPIPSFYAEWLALLLGLTGLPLLAAGRSPGFPRVAPFLVPRIALLPAGLAVCLLLQLVFAPAGTSTPALIALLYLLWLTLLMLFAAALRQRVGLPRLARWLAFALALAAALNACSAILWSSGMRAGLGWLFLMPSAGGNLGQVNMLVDLLWIGIVSALYCRRNSRHAWAWSLLVPVLLLASALTGARAPLLYAVWLPVAAWLFGDRKSLRAACITGASYFLIVAAVHVVPPNVLAPMGDGAGNDSVARISAGMRTAPGENVRLNLIRAAAEIAEDHPLLGSGWGSFSWESYHRASANTGWWATGENAHQLFFQLAAELGLPAAVFALVMLLAWAGTIWRVRAGLRTQPETGWAIAAAGVTLLHAQLEYPLWYAHLLGVCGILLACAEPKTFSFDVRPSRLAVGTVMLVGVFLLGTTGVDYVRIQRWVYRDMNRANAPVPDAYYRELAAWGQGSLLQPQVIRILSAVMPPTRDHLDEKRVLCARALHGEPQSPAVFTCALLDELAGEHVLAETNWRQAARVFGAQLPAYLQKLEAVPSNVDADALAFARRMQAAQTQ